MLQQAMQPQNRGTLIGVALAAAAGYMLMQSSNHRQISWQEFRTNYLEKGEVSDDCVGTQRVQCPPVGAGQSSGGSQQECGTSPSAQGQRDRGE